MRRLLAALAALGCAADAGAQGVRISPYVGSFDPMLPVVSVADGYNPDVELASAPAVGVEVEGAPTRLPWLHLYAGLAHAAPRLHLSGAMEAHEANGPSVRSRILLPTAGIVISPRVGRLPVRPIVRVGAGAKSYRFDLAERRDRVTDFTGDLGVGLAGGAAGGVVLTAEARWLPSRFDARNLPIRVEGGALQNQNDWLFQLGVRLAP